MNDNQKPIKICVIFSYAAGEKFEDTQQRSAALADLSKNRYVQYIIDPALKEHLLSSEFDSVNKVLDVLKLHGFQAQKGVEHGQMVIRAKPDKGNPAP